MTPPAWSTVADAWRASRNYWIVTSRPDGRAHAAPVWGLWFDGTLWFGTGAESVKAHNLAADPRLVAHLESGDQVAIIEGSAAPTAIPRPAEFADAYEAKYGWRPDLNDPFYRLVPDVGLTWDEETFPSRKFRWHW